MPAIFQPIAYYDQSYSKTAQDAMKAIFQAKAIELLSENAVFNIKAQQKRYKFAKDAINNPEALNGAAANSAMILLQFSATDYFTVQVLTKSTTNIINDLTVAYSNLTSSGSLVDVWNYLAGVNVTEI